MTFFKVSQLIRQMKAIVVLLAATITMISGMNAMADDTEIFYGSTATATAPNIMMILDTSGSMNTLVTTAIVYDPAVDYSTYSTCIKDKIYYSTSSTVPTCSGTLPYIDASVFYCSPATGTGGALNTVGTYVDNAARWTATKVVTSVSTPAPIITTTTKIVHKQYTSGSSSSRSSPAATTSSSSSAGSASSASTSAITYIWQNNLNISSSSSSASSTSSNPATSSSSSSSSTFSISSSSPYVTQVDTTTTTVTTAKTTTTSTYAITRTLGDVTCSHDAGASGFPNGVSPTSGTEWTTVSTNSYWSSGSTPISYHFYTGNYLNYKKSPQTTSRSRIGIMQDAVSALLNSSSGVNVGLMRYNSGGNGGMVVEPITPIDTVKNNIIADVNSWGPASDTPLSETLYEAYLYFTGGAVKYGKNSSAYFCNTWDANHVCTSSSTSSFPSVAASRVGSSSSASSYQSPMNYTCQKNYVVYLTDGAPNADTDADGLIDGLSSTDAACFTSDAAMWSYLGWPQPSTTGGRCTAVLTSYMYNNDLSSSLATTQNVTTYFVGLGSEAGGGGPLAYLTNAAKAGGGQAYAATDLAGLSTVFNKIFDSIKTDASAFTSPAVAVNAFNRTQVLDDLYLSVFKPSTTWHWPGNLKKYKLHSSQITDVNGNSAVDSKGNILSTGQDYWSSSVNQNNVVTIGGAAEHIPDPASRNVYTYVGSNPGGTTYESAMQNFDTSNSNLTAAKLGTTAALHDTLIAWARGQDTNDDNNDGSTTDTRHVMGDPIHSQPQVVIYGNSSSATTTSAKLKDAAVYTLTNDGYLHAFDVTTGVELWSFIPEDALSNLANLYANDITDTKHYILDGNIRVVKWDVNGDGVVDPSAGDKVFLYFSQGRGGSHYYALDVTNKTAPKFMWNLGPSQLPDIAKSWSTPAVGKVSINGATQNTQKMVLIFAGGYDEAEENVSYSSPDNSGRAIYMVDAVTGSLLWSGGYPSIGASQSFANMDHSIPSDVTIIDTNGDGYTDRMYVGDMAGQLWRFDIYNGSAASSLVTGGVIASLGTHDDSTHPDANNRRFYNAPDVALITSSTQKNYFNISIGSGYRGHPKNTATADRFYAIRDYSPFIPLSSYTKVTDGQLDDITGNVYAGTVPTLTANTPGWKLILNASGEKILSQSLTLQGTVMFTSYIPATAQVSCSPAAGTARIYSININDGTIKFSSAYEQHDINGLPSNIQVINNSSLISSDDPSSSSSSSSSSTSIPQGCTGLMGTSILGQSVCPGMKLKTLWKDLGAE